MKHTKSLREFIQRAQVLALFRLCLRATKGLDRATSKDLRAWIRSEFELHRTVEDADHIKMLLTKGRAQLREISSSLDLSRA